MQYARTGYFISVAVIAAAIGHQVSYSAEKGQRLKQPAGIRSDHMLMIPLDATVTAPIFSISWWSRVTPAPDVNRSPNVFREVERTDAISPAGVK